MIILGFESTAKIASVAITDGEKTLISYSSSNGLTHSELLLPMAENALAELNLKFSDVGAYAAATGPGSFTGVRIGAALVKGLAFGKNIPCVSVSALEALAENLTEIPGIIVPCMDARRAQVYTAVFRSENGKTARLTEDMAISVEELSELLKKYENEKIYIVGDGYELVREYLCGRVSTAETPSELIAQNAESVCRVAYRKILNGELTTDLALTASYLRLPQAERERLEREKNSK